MGNQATPNVNNLIESQQYSIRWVFILKDEPKKQHRKKIDNYFYSEQRWDNNLGFSYLDYCQIMKRMLAQSQRLKVYLVMDVENYLIIFKQKADVLSKLNECVSQVFLFPSSDQKGFDIDQIKRQNPIIDKDTTSFQIFLNQDEKQIAKEQSKSLLSNFNILGTERSLRNYQQRRMKIYACITLQEKYYSEYMEKFYKALQIQTFLSIIDNFVMQELIECLRLLKAKKVRKFYKKMFDLYKIQSRFYYLVNSSIKRFYQQGFDWDSYVLPISLLFKAIKYYFDDPVNKEEIEKLFDKNGECFLWRAAQLPKDELSEIKSSLNSKEVYFQHVSFTSTSVSKEIAMSFLEAKNLKDFCIIKYKLKKPSWEYQANDLDFMVLSFAHLFGKHSDIKFEKEILLNSLTICKLTSLSSIGIKQIRKLNKALEKKLMSIYQKVTIPIIEMQILQTLIDKKKQEELNMLHANQIPKPIKHYLSTIDIIKNNKLFDIGHAFEYSGKLEQAYKHFERLLDEQKKKEHKDYKQLYYLQSRLVDILQKMDNTEQALLHVKDAIKICDILEKQDVNMTRKDHQQLLYKMMQKSGYLLQTNYYYHEALHQVNCKLQQLLKKAEKQKVGKQASLFHYSQYLIQRGMIQYREGEVGKARNDFEESKKKIQQILIDIDYQGLKKETFYIEFIIHFLIDEKVQWNSKEYIKQKRMKNIAEATYIFGGQIKLMHVQSSSRELSKEINEFIERRKKQIQQQKQKLSTKYIQHESMVIQVQNQFRNHPKTLQIKKQLLLFFQYFHKIIQNSEDQTKNKIKTLQQEIQKIIVQQIPSNCALDHVRSSQLKLYFLKQSIIECQLKDWKATYSDNQNWQKLQLKFDKILILKREQTHQFIQTLYESRNKDNFRKYCQDSIAQIKQMQVKYEEQGLNFPEKFKSKLQNLKAKLYESLGNISQAIKIHNKISSNSSKDTNFKLIDKISAYLSKIRLQFGDAQLDFSYNLLYRTPNIIKETQQRQRKIIDQCKKILNQVQQLLQKLQNKLHKNIVQQPNHKISIIISEKRVELSVWLLKFNVYTIHIEGKIQTNQMKNVEHQFANLMEDIESKLKHSPKKVQYLGEYYQLNSFYFYILEDYLCSFKNIQKGANILKEAGVIKQIKLLTKLFFLFADFSIFKSNYIDLTYYTQQLDQFYLHYQNFPSFWRICLAFHFQYRFNSPTKNQNALGKCIRILKTMPRQKFRLRLLQECEQKMYQSYLQGIQTNANQELMIRSETTISTTMNELYSYEKEQALHQRLVGWIKLQKKTNGSILFDRVKGEINSYQTKFNNSFNKSSTRMRKK